jgi:hypothetical protein
MFSTYMRDQEGKEWASVKAATGSWSKKLSERIQVEAEQEEAEGDKSD